MHEVVQHAPSLKKDELVSIVQYDHVSEMGTPIAVGRMALNMDGSVDGDRSKGKAVHVLHTWKDYLWDLGTKGDLPVMTKKMTEGEEDANINTKVDEAAVDVNITQPEPEKAVLPDPESTYTPQGIHKPHHRLLLSLTVVSRRGFVVTPNIPPPSHPHESVQTPRIILPYISYQLLLAPHITLSPVLIRFLSNNTHRHQTFDIQVAYRLPEAVRQRRAHQDQGNQVRGRHHRRISQTCRRRRTSSVREHQSCGCEEGETRRKDPDGKSESQRDDGDRDVETSSTDCQAF